MKSIMDGALIIWFLLVLFILGFIVVDITKKESSSDSKSTKTVEQSKPAEPEFEVLFPASKAREESRKNEIRSLHVLTRGVEERIRHTS